MGGIVKRLPMFVKFHPPSSTFIHFHPLSFTLIHSHPLFQFSFWSGLVCQGHIEQIGTIKHKCWWMDWTGSLNGRTIRAPDGAYKWYFALCGSKYDEKQ